MSNYQVLARKWRPQQFDDVIGQRGVTQTLRNAIAAGRIAQAFVFSGPRGVGKTTTARILARGLSCEKGPTADPCGVCDACLEIAQGRDIDVLEIDAATNTQVDKVRDIIISGLGVAPVRNRYKIFIIDEVHRLSPAAFDALLKSVEEPPPHVVFMMATTELEKVPATIQSRSQVFELKTIGVRQIADQLRRIADAEGIQVDDASLMLVARAGDGSMRDAQSALDQVIAFAGQTIAADDVTAVLGLVRRDLLIEMADAVAREDAGAAFELAGRAVESGYDLRLVIRELARLTRDVLVVGMDASRIDDPEIAADSERDRILTLASKFSREDLMRAFDVLTKAEVDIKAAAQPRFHLEMALMRWIHLRRLVPLTDLIDGLEKGGGSAPRASAPASMPRPAAAAPRPAPKTPAATASTVRAIEAVREAPARRAVPRDDEGGSNGSEPPHPARIGAPQAATAPVTGAPQGATAIKDAFLADVQRTKKFFYGTVLAQAQKIEVEPHRVVLTFAPQHRALREQLETGRVWLEEIASRVAGTKMSVVGVEGAAGPAPGKPGAPGGGQRDPGSDKQAALKKQAMSDSGVQAMLDVFAAEIKDVEEM